MLFIILLEAHRLLTLLSVLRTRLLLQVEVLMYRQQRDMILPRPQVETLLVLMLPPITLQEVQVEVLVLHILLRLALLLLPLPRMLVLMILPERLR
jgi:hypothetical protein